MKDTIITNNTIVLNDTIAQITHTIIINEGSGDSNQLIYNLTTILLALIAALIALYQVKSNIISSSRIAWIENLRTAISEYVAEVNDCVTVISNMRDECLEVDQDKIKEVVDKFYPSYMKSSREIDKLGYKALLHLNSNETSHKKVEDIIISIDEQLHKNKLSDLDKDKIEEDIRKIVKNTKLIFKAEWTKSKRLFKI